MFVDLSLSTLSFFHQTYKPYSNQKDQRSIHLNELMLSSFVQNHPSSIDSTLTILNCDNQRITTIDVDPLHVQSSGTSNVLTTAPSLATHSRPLELNLAISASIEVLILSRNLLSNLLGIFQFSKCHTLNLSNNRLTTIESCQPLSTLRHLKRLTLAGNSVCRLPNYRPHLLSITSSQSPSENEQSASGLRFCRLHTLDDIPVTLEEELEARVQLRTEQTIIPRLTRKKRLCTFLDSYLQRKFLHSEMQRRGLLDAANFENQAPLASVLAFGVCAENPAFDTSYSTQSLRRLVASQRNKILSNQCFSNNNGEGVAVVRGRPSWALAFEEASNFLDDNLSKKLLSIRSFHPRWNGEEHNTPDVDALSLLCSSSSTPAFLREDRRVKLQAFLTWKKEQLQKSTLRKDVIRRFFTKWVSRHTSVVKKQQTLRLEAELSKRRGSLVLRSCFDQWRRAEGLARSIRERTTEFARSSCFRLCFNRWKLAIANLQLRRSADSHLQQIIKLKVLRRWRMAFAAVYWSRSCLQRVFLKWKQLASATSAVRKRRMSKVFNRWVLRMLMVTYHKKQHVTAQHQLSEVSECSQSLVQAVVDEDSSMAAPASCIPSPHPPPAGTGSTFVTFPKLETTASSDTVVVVASHSIPQLEHSSASSVMEASPVDHSATPPSSLTTGTPSYHLPSVAVEQQDRLFPAKRSELKTMVSVATSTDRVRTSETGVGESDVFLTDQQVPQSQAASNSTQDGMLQQYQNELIVKNKQLEWALETIRTLQSRVEVLESIERASIETIDQYERELSSRDMTVGKFSFAKNKRVH